MSTEVDTRTRAVANEIDRTAGGLDKSEITREGLQSVVERMDNRVPDVVEDCMRKMVEQCSPQALERYLDEHLSMTVHQLVCEIRPQLKRIGANQLVSHAEQYFVTPDINKGFEKTCKIPVGCKKNHSTLKP